MGGRIVKGEGESADDKRPTHHGSPNKKGFYEARGNLRRMNEKPKPAPWSKDKRKP